MVVKNVHDNDGLATTNSDAFDDDGRPKRTGTVWTASSHIITAVIGSGVLSLAWAVAQIGWIAGPIIMLLFSLVTYYTSSLLCCCYRSGDPVTGKRNYTYMDAIHANLGGIKVKICGVVQYVNLFGTAIGYTIASAVSMIAIERTHCKLKNGGQGVGHCHVNGNPYMIGFGVVQVIFSQIPDFDQLWWLSIVAAVMSFGYSGIGLGLGISKLVDNNEIKGSLTGVTVGTITETQKVWRTFQSLGNMAFAYSYSMILIEIQDTVKSPPSEEITMRKATLVSVVVTTAFYMACGCVGYAAFGDAAPGNLLAADGFSNPYWLLDIANLAIVIHLVGAYQVYCQPLFQFVEREASKRYPESDFITKEIKIPFPGKPFNLNLFRLVWRTIFVILTTLIAMLIPFFNDVLGLLGALAFWPLTVYFPVEMFIVQKNVKAWSTRWTCLQVLSVVCLIVSVAAAAGSIVGIVSGLKNYKPFKSDF